MEKSGPEKGHLKPTGEQSRLYCNICNGLFEESGVLSDHEPCPFCPERVCDLKKHLRYHNEGRAERCDLCVFSVETKLGIYRHKFWHNAKLEPSTVKFVEPNVENASNNDEMKHKVLDHSYAEESISATDSSTIEEPDKDPIPAKASKIEADSIEEPFDESKEKKSKKVHKVRCNKCPLQLPSSKRKLHFIKHHDPRLPFECIFCYYRSGTLESIRSHQNVYHSKRVSGNGGEDYEMQLKMDLISGFKMKCKVCPTTFSPGDEERHMKDHHDPDLPFKCKYCEYRSLGERSLPLHENQFHYKDKETKFIPCINDCGRHFSTVKTSMEHAKNNCRRMQDEKDLMKQKIREYKRNWHLKKKEKQRQKGKEKA